MVGVRMRNWIKLFEDQQELFPGYDQQHRKERFAKWAGDADPDIYYHATIKDFDAFKTKGTGFSSVLGMTFEVDRHGAFFARDPEFALEYITDMNGKIKEGGRIIPVYLAIHNPLDLTDNGLSRMSDELKEDFAQHGVDLRSIYFHMYEYNRWELFDGEDGELMVSAMKALGYDGAILRERTEHAHDGTVMVALYPSQIKSATGNRGSFDPNREKITEAFDIGIIENPTRNEYIKLLRNATETLRVLGYSQHEDPIRGCVALNNHNLYVWESPRAAHGGVADRYNLGNIIHLMMSGKAVTVKTMWRYERLGFTKDDIELIVRDAVRDIMPAGFTIVVEDY
jgi:uncharacterized protein with GYD domain